MSLVVGEWQVDLVELLRDERTVARLPGTPFAINVLLLRREGLTAVVDTGSGAMGPVMTATTGTPFVTELEPALSRHGVGPEDVDLILLTHLDGDHVGGALAGEWPGAARPAFPAVRVVASRVEVEAARSTAEPLVYEGGPAAVAALEPMLETVEDGDEVAAGVRLRLAPGHTAGHSIFEVAGERPLVYSADVFHTTRQLPEPAPASGDRDPELGLETRRRVLAELAERDALVYAAHQPGPNPGTIERHGAGYRWVTGN